MSVALDEFAAVNDAFSQRLRRDLATLTKCRATFLIDPASSTLLDEFQSCAHKLAGAAGIFGFPEISDAAAALEDSIIGQHSGDGADRIATNADALIRSIESL